MKFSPTPLSLQKKCQLPVHTDQYLASESKRLHPFLETGNTDFILKFYSRIRESPFSGIYHPAGGKGRPPLHPYCQGLSHPDLAPDRLSPG